MLIKDIMSSPALCIDYKTTIDETIDIMKNENLGFLPITKNDSLIGVITDRDILIRRNNFKRSTKIYKIMSTPAIIINEDDTLKEAAIKMSKFKKRRLVVVDDTYIKGVITSKDLLVEESLLPYIIDTYK